MQSPPSLHASGSAPSDAARAQRPAGSPGRKVLVVDDERATLELLGLLLERQGFEVTLCGSVPAAQLLLGEARFDAVLSDVMFEGSDRGTEVIRAARSLAPRAAVILMTGYPAVDRAVNAIRDGAVDYLQKPVDPVVLGATIHRAVRDAAATPEELSYQDLVDILSDLVAQTIERVDPYTAGHGERTRRYCRQIAQGFGLDRRTTERLELAAIAHDYGKIYLDDLGFLTKKGPLTPAEFRAVQRHPEVGARKLGSNVHLGEVCGYVAEHHERWDGSGYPERLKGSAISIPGRILCVVEVFDSLSTKRSYKRPWDLQKCLDFFEANSGRAFEPEILDVFLRLLEVHGEDWLRAPALDLAARGVAPALEPV